MAGLQKLSDIDCASTLQPDLNGQKRGTDQSPEGLIMRYYAIALTLVVGDRLFYPGRLRRVRQQAPRDTRCSYRANDRTTDHN